ncbi:MAG: DHHW family protein, partial [Clostridiales bacterium]
MNNKILTISFVFILLSCALINILTPSQSFSVNENRYLQQFPQFSWEKIFNGTFTEQFAQYTTDQFPLRDIWIGAKTQTEKTLGKKDNGRVFFGKDDYLFAKDTPADPTLLQNNLQAIEQFVEKTSQKNPQISFSLLLAPTSASVLEDKLPPLAPIIPQELLFQD